MNNLHTKQAIARAKGVSDNTIDAWVARGLLARPIKLGTSKQARVRWSDEQIAELDEKLAALGRKAATTG